MPSARPRVSQTRKHEVHGTISNWRRRFSSDTDFRRAVRRCRPLTRAPVAPAYWSSARDAGGAGGCGDGAGPVAVGDGSRRVYLVAAADPPDGGPLDLHVSPSGLRSGRITFGCRLWFARNRVSDQPSAREADTPEPGAEPLPGGGPVSRPKRARPSPWHSGALFHATTRYPRKPPRGAG